MVTSTVKKTKGNPDVFVTSAPTLIVPKNADT